MAGGTLWKGYIHFGDTNVEVKLHPAVKEERVQFHLLHKRDRVKLRQQMICAYEQLPVPAGEQARGFEVEEGKYVIVAPEELEETVPGSSRLIEVHEFVKTGEIDQLYLDRVYYLEPGESPRRYGALAAALRETGTSGICTWTMRKRSYFGALQAGGGALRLGTLRHADEVVSASSLDLPEIALSEKELEIGVELIGHLAAPFEPGKFRDEHQEKLRQLIDRKARGEKIALLRPRRLKPTGPDELLRALEASLKKVA